MKKSKIAHSVNWQSVMRISFIQFVASFVLIGFSYAHTTHAQAILEKEVSVKMVNVPLKEAIQNIQEQTQVKFVYSSRVNLKTKVSINAEKMKLQTVLEKLFAPTPIGYRVINNQIVLTTDKGQASLDDAMLLNPAAEPAPAFVVKGKVLDEKGEEIPGVNVFVKELLRVLLPMQTATTRLTPPTKTLYWYSVL
jgi:hypothetical protein